MIHLNKQGELLLLLGVQVPSELLHHLHHEHLLLLGLGRGAGGGCCWPLPLGGLCHGVDVVFPPVAVPSAHPPEREGTAAPSLHHAPAHVGHGHGHGVEVRRPLAHGHHVVAHGTLNLPMWLLHGLLHVIHLHHCLKKRMKRECEREKEGKRVWCWVFVCLCCLLFFFVGGFFSIPYFLSCER